MKLRFIEKFCPQCDSIEVLNTKLTLQDVKMCYSVAHFDVATNVVRINVECKNCYENIH